MTTATTVAGRPLSGWSRDARHGTWYALVPGRSGEPALGVLRIDRALLATEGTRERLAAAVLAVAKLRLPGVLGTVDLVAEAGEVWLITARPPVPTLADLLANGGSGLDAGSAASVLNETAQTLLALHKAGLAHGTLGTDTVVLAPDGVALLAEAVLGTVLGDAPGSSRREADIAAWADLSRSLGGAWAAPGSPAATLLAQCSVIAGSEGLAPARAALVAGRAALPAGFLQRTELRAAVAATAPEITAAPTADERSDGTAAEGAHGLADERVDGTADEGAHGPADGSAAPAAGPHDQATLLGERDRTPRRTHCGHQTHLTPRQAPATAPDDQATVLGRRNRTPIWPAPAEPVAEPAADPEAAPTAAGWPAPTGVDDGEILLRFGPGIP
ncbi:hypothetical protein AB0H32_30805, partial [Streptomyces sp. NPDC020362]